jgi:Protein of unknown function (DUF3465)
MNKAMKFPVCFKVIAYFLVSVFFFQFPVEVAADSAGIKQQQAVLVNTSNWILKQAFQNQQSGLQVQGRGIVKRVLSDDVNGDRHQRFILQLGSKQTLLIAHNIDIAPRLKGLKSGDKVTFYGLYEWNNKGGLIHWTHHDPDGIHVRGWLRFKGKLYQ